MQHADVQTCLPK